MICNEVQLNKKFFVIDENSNIFDSNIELLFLKYLNFYLKQNDYKKVANLYIRAPEYITNLGYSSLGNLIIKNTKFTDIRENENLYLATMYLDFDLSKLDDSVRENLINLFKMISNLFRMQKWTKEN